MQYIYYKFRGVITQKNLVHFSKRISKNAINPKKSHKFHKNLINLSISYTFFEVIYPLDKFSTYSPSYNHGSFVVK